MRALDPEQQTLPKLNATGAFTTRGAPGLRPPKGQPLPIITRSPKPDLYRLFVIALVGKYAKMFPGEARRIYTIFIAATWGATVSQQLASELSTQPPTGAGAI